MLVEAELDLTTAMLALPANPSFTEMRQQPLAFLTQAQEDLRGCVSSPPQNPLALCWLGGPGSCISAAGHCRSLHSRFSLQMAVEAPSHQPSRKLRHWLQKLQTAKKTVSQGSRARGFRGVRDSMAAQGLLHPISSANLPFLPTAGDRWLSGGLCHPPPLPSAERPALRSPPGPMHLAPADSVAGTARHSPAPKDALRTGKKYIYCIAGLYFLFKHFFYLCELGEQFFSQFFKLLGFIVYL